MHFDNGKFGAVVIVLALIGTIVLGYCTDVTKVEGVRTDYDYITDITGLFETEQVPEYIEYNPNSNYVGYTGPVVYDVSSQPNNYRYEIAPGETSTDMDRLYYNEYRSIPTEFSNSSVLLNYTGSSYTLSPQFIIGGVGYNVLTNVESMTPSVTTLAEIIDNAEITVSDFATIEVRFAFENVNYPVFAFPSFSSFSQSDSGGFRRFTSVATDDNIVDRMVIDVRNLSTVAYRGNSEVWRGIATSIPVVYSYQANDYLGSATANHVPITLRMDFTLTTPPTYGYADPTGGVTLSAPLPFADWDNGYENQTITLLVGRNTSVSFDQSLVISFDSEPYNLNLFVRFLSNGTLETEVGYLDGTTSISDTQTYGKWQGLEIVFDRQDVTLTATPSGTIRDYTTEPSILGDEYVLFDMDTPITDAEYGFSATTLTEGTPYFGVLSTVVNLNSYNAVMNNPSIDIKDYWPNLDDYRLNFYSFALVGESVTINGVEYLVGDGQTITVTESVAEGETAETYTQVLSNIYVSTDTVDGVRHTYLTFVDDRLTVDLGETVTEVVSFSGLWYFTTALYDAETVTYSEYEWNLDGKFGLSYDVVFLIFIVLCIAGIILGRMFLPDSMHFLDYVLIIGAIVIAFACMEVFL